MPSGQHGRQQFVDYLVLPDHVDVDLLQHSLARFVEPGELFQIGRQRLVHGGHSP